MSTQRQARGAAGVARIHAKLKTSLESGNFYEAHQFYRTLYFRYVTVFCDIDFLVQD